MPRDLPHFQPSCSGFVLVPASEGRSSAMRVLPVSVRGPTRSATADAVAMPGRAARPCAPTCELRRATRTATKPTVARSTTTAVSVTAQYVDADGMGEVQAAAGSAR